ncbi:MAG TPA: energy transducer TonB [Acidobacteriaceae bacterium]|jgi:TonB family protein|nr:energy transducer TonB [Acidobacteriaceae bacterium]
MRAIGVTAVLLSLALLPSTAQSAPAQTPRALQGVTPDTAEVPERILHPLATSESDISAGTASAQPVFVSVSYLVSATGDVQDAVGISGPAALLDAAADGVKRWKYQPYVVDNQPRPVKSIVVIEFQDGVGKRIEPPPPPPEESAPPAAVPPPATAPRTVRISAGVAAGMLIHNVDPVYPADARAAHVQGTVILHAIISEAGTIDKLTVVSGPPMLTAAAIDAVRQWTYRPYLLNGDPTAVDTTINVSFALNTSP